MPQMKFVIHEGWVGCTGLWAPFVAATTYGSCSKVTNGGREGRAKLSRGPGRPGVNSMPS